MYCKCRLAEGMTSCPECGTPVNGSRVKPQSSAPASVPPERRLLTILFCDLVGSTALAARHDPEDLHEMLATYQRQATRLIEAAGGMVARYAGDGVLAYFGFPAAREDDAERAVKAGLDLTARINEGHALSETFNVRVGIATGVVIVGDLLQSASADRPPVVGETPNLAARLQALAEPGTVVIASDTRRLVGGLFEYLPMPLTYLKGYIEPVAAWQVLGESKLASRFEALRTKGTLVGREAEIGRLMELWSKASRGEGQVAILSGEAGIGKSRLAREVIRRTKRELPAIRRYDCSPHHTSSMLHPLLEQLRRAALFDPADSVEAKLEKLEVLASSTGDAAREVTAVIGDLMALPRSERFQPPRLDARRKLDFLFQALIQGLEAVARLRPMIILAEDVHWMDATSRELLGLMIDRIRALPVLMVLTARGDTEAAWQHEPHVATIPLGAIDARSAEILVRRFADRGQLEDAVVERILARADGIPLFLEELTRSALESSGAEVGPAPAAEPTGGRLVTIPATLQASLMSRLDRLGPARRVAMVAAALGREFRLDLLSALLPTRSAENLQACLDQLIDAELIVPAGARPEPAFAFRHALIQDAAYSTLLRGDRKAMHGQIARVLQRQFPDIAAMQPEIVAGHFANADMREEAIDCWLMAGRRASSRSAAVEAVQHFSEGIRLAATLPPSAERTRRQIDLHIGLGPAIMAAKGYAAGESLEVFQRADALVNEGGDVLERMEVLLGLYNVHYGRAELDDALTIAQRNMTLARTHGRMLGRAHTILGQTLASMGAFAEARHHLEQSVDIFDREPEVTAELGIFSGQQVVALSFLAGIYFALGEPELARHVAARSIEQANASEHPMSIALALVTDRLTPIPGGLDPDPDRAAAAVRFCERHGLRNFEMWARFALGATIVRRGDCREGMEMIRSAIATADAMNSRLFRPVQLATLAGGHARLGEIGEAFALIEKAIEVAERTGERQATASLYRAHGELLWAVGKPEKGAQRFTVALEIARMQGAKAEEARIERKLAELRAKRESPAKPEPGATDRGENAVENRAARLRVS
ncbi:MAG TPA: adenylate/guanylate cyclase domain-containing protein [Hyphomicrobiales bacterium]